MRLLPELTPPKRHRAGNPFALFCLAPCEVFLCPRCYLRGGELLPRHFTLTVAGSQSFQRGGLISATLSVDRSFRHLPPRLSPGTLPCGVRTFLSSPKEQATVSDLFDARLRCGDHFSRDIIVAQNVTSPTNHGRNIIRISPVGFLATGSSSVTRGRPSSRQEARLSLADDLPRGRKLVCHSRMTFLAAGSPSVTRG